MMSAMSWRDRLNQVLLAGGALTMSGCFSSCCNANPDPCCSAPHSQACTDEHDCLSRGFYYDEERRICVVDMAVPADMSVARDLAETVRDFSSSDGDITDGSSED
jgi:hypothetical protein